jgi:hypothetical protein
MAVAVMVIAAVQAKNLADFMMFSPESSKELS